LLINWFMTSGIGRKYAEIPLPIINAINHIIMQFIYLQCGKSQTAGKQVTNHNKQYTIANTQRATPCSGREGDKRVLVRRREGGDIFKLLNKLCQLLTKSSTVILHVPVSILAHVVSAHNDVRFTGVEWKGFNHTTQNLWTKFGFPKLIFLSMYRIMYIVLISTYKPQ
jgi:hypothetical protein